MSCRQYLPGKIFLNFFTFLLETIIFEYLEEKCPEGISRWLISLLLEGPLSTMWYFASSAELDGITTGFIIAIYFFPLLAHIHIRSMAVCII